MDKKITALAAVLAAAFTASATTTTNQLYTFGVQSLTVGDILYTTKDDNGLGTGDKYWALDEAATNSFICAYDTDETAKYLYVDETNALRRLLFHRDSSTVAQSIPSSGSVYMKSSVWFTPSESESAPTPATGDKILIWMLTDGTTTNLVVTAANAAGTESENYTIDNFTAAAETWYNLEVRAAQQTEDTAQFTVFLKGTNDTEYVQLASGTTQTFTSLVNSGSNKLTVTSMGFQGSGKVDDLEFGTYAEEITTFDVTLNVTTTGDVWGGDTIDNCVLIGASADPSECAYAEVTTFTVGAVSTLYVFVGTAEGNTVTSTNGTFSYDTDMSAHVMQLDVSQQKTDMTIAISVVASTSDFPSDWNGGTTPDADIVSAYETWSTTYATTLASTTLTSAQQEQAFLLGIEPKSDADTTLSVTAISVGSTIDLTTNKDLSAANGYVYAVYGSTPTTMDKSIKITNGQISLTRSGTAQFIKIVVGYSTPSGTNE